MGIFSTWEVGIEDQKSTCNSASKSLTPANQKFLLLLTADLAAVIAKAPPTKVAAIKKKVKILF